MKLWQKCEAMHSVEGRGKPLANGLLVNSGLRVVFFLANAMPSGTFKLDTTTLVLSGLPANDDESL